MDFLPKAIDEFVARHTEPENELLSHINRETHLKVMMPRMLSGHVQGRILSMLSHMIKPKCILEIGTYTGYSALCFAEGLQPDGKLITIDINEELESRVRGYFNDSPYNNLIDYRVGDATEIIPSLNEKFDLVFIDADKNNYPKYFDLVFDKVNPGGYIIADNVLWSGRVVEELNKNDKDTPGIIEYCNKVANDSRVQPVLFAVRDGLMICRKK
jgi:caffeoyl-CoA O-methyltransferase